MSEVKLTNHLFDDQSAASVDHTNRQTETKLTEEDQHVLPEIDNNITCDPSDLIGEPFNYDYILETHIGQLGKFQLRSFLWLCLPALLPGFVTMSYSFTGGVPEYRCLVDGCDVVDNSTGLVNVFDPPWLNNTLPKWDSSSSEDRLTRQCYRYNYTWANVDECLTGGDNIQRDQIEKCDRLVYDTSTFGSTIVTEFDLTCDNDWKESYPGIAFMVGQFFGPSTFGFLADKFGRKPTYTLCILLLACAVTGSAFSMSLITFCILRLLSGFCNIGLFELYTVWGVEAVGKRYRVVCSFMYQLCYTIGSAFLGLIAFYVRDWRILQFIVGLPLFLCATLYWIVPESIRWLISKRRYDEAGKLISKAAKVNGKVVPDHLLVAPSSNGKSNEKKSEQKNDNDDAYSAIKGEGISDVFRSKILLKRFIILMFAWFAAVMGYYGITFAINNLSGNYYINYELVMLIEIPSYICGIYVTDKAGRRPTLSISLILSGIACLITGLVPENPPVIRIVFSLIGKFFISLVLAIVYSFTAELFPTKIRSSMIGLCSTSGRIGGILAPILADVGRRIDPALPYIFFAMVNILVGGLCILLPESNQSPLPSTIQDAIDMEKYSLDCSVMGCNKKIQNTSSG